MQIFTMVMGVKVNWQPGSSLEIQGIDRALALVGNSYFMMLAWMEPGLIEGLWMVYQAVLEL